MKQFFIFVKKEFFHIFRDKRTLLILFGMPVAQIILFGFAITNEIRNADIAILDQSKDAMTIAISNKLLSSGYFRLAAGLPAENDLTRAFQKGDIKLVVVFPPRFAYRFSHGGEARVQLIADASDPNTATTLINYATAIIQQYQAGASPGAQPPQQIKTQIKMMYNPELRGVYMFVPGVMTLILMLVSAMMTSITIAREKELGTMEILLASPLKPWQIIAGKVIPYLLLSAINALVIVWMGRFIFGMPVKGSVALLAAECLLFIITSLSLGILISTRTSTQQTAMMISMAGLLLPTVLLSGFIFPIDSMPWLLRALSNIIPAKWFIIIIKDIMLKGAGAGLIWQPTAVLLLMTLVFLAASVRSFKIRLS